MICTIALSLIHSTSRFTTTQAGLKSGDRLYQIQGRPQEQWVASKGGNKMSLADLVMIKLNHIAKNRNAKNVHLTVERLHDVLDKHEAEHAASHPGNSETTLKLKVARERQLMSFLNQNGLGKYGVAVLRMGVGSTEELRAVPTKDLLSKAKFGMTKADVKRLAAAPMEDDVVIDDAGNSGGEGGGGGGGGGGGPAAVVSEDPSLAPPPSSSSVMAVSVSASAAAMTSEATKAMQLLRAVIYGSSSAPPPTPPTGNAASWQQQASDDLSSWAGVTLDSSGAKVLELDLSYCSLAVGNGGLAAMRPCLRLLSDIQSLTLTGNEQLTGDLEAFLGILPNLTTLYLDDCPGKNSERKRTTNSGRNAVPALHPPVLLFPCSPSSMLRRAPQPSSLFHPTLPLQPRAGLTGNISSLGSMKQLATVNLDNCTSIVGSKSALKEKLPNLRIISAHGTSTTG